MVETLSPVLSDVTEGRITGILKVLSAQNWTLATAESCTGGLLSSLFTDVAGHSHVFLAGYVTYANRAKTDMLGIPADLIAAQGAVSKPVALAMAEGALARSGSTVALAITGYAGAAPAGEEAGLVHFACARQGKPSVHQEAHFGDQGRGQTRLLCIRTAVKLVHQLVVVPTKG